MLKHYLALTILVAFPSFSCALTTQDMMAISDMVDTLDTTSSSMYSSDYCGFQTADGAIKNSAPIKVGSACSKADTAFGSDITLVNQKLHSLVETIQTSYLVPGSPQVPIEVAVRRAIDLSNALSLFALITEYSACKYRLTDQSVTYDMMFGASEDHFQDVLKRLFEAMALAPAIQMDPYFVDAERKFRSYMEQTNKLFNRYETGPDLLMCDPVIQEVDTRF